MSEWRIGEHYGIHVYEGDRPVATFHRAEDAARAVAAVAAQSPVGKYPSPGRPSTAGRWVARLYHLLDYLSRAGTAPR